MSDQPPIIESNLNFWINRLSPQEAWNKWKAKSFWRIENSRRKIGDFRIWRNNSNNSTAADYSFIIIFLYFFVHYSLGVDNFELQMHMQTDSRLWQWIGGNLAKNGIHVTSHTCKMLSGECGNHWIFEHLEFEIFEKWPRSVKSNDIFLKIRKMNRC